jgi:hypothetical protein
MKSIALLFSLILPFGVTAGEVAPSCNDNFGENVQVFTELVDYADGKVNLKGDFNGDGIKDHIVILVIDKTSKFAPDTELLNPFLKVLGTKPGDVTISAGLPTVKTVALGIVHGAPPDKACKKFVVYNRDFFPTSTGESVKDVISLGIHTPGDTSHISWADLKKTALGRYLTHDIVQLAGSSGEVFLFWGKKTYQVYWGEEGGDS